MVALGQDGMKTRKTFPGLPERPQFTSQLKQPSIKIKPNMSTIFLAKKKGEGGNVICSNYFTKKACCVR